jgi:hypothetical protein
MGDVGAATTMDGSNFQSRLGSGASLIRQMTQCIAAAGRAPGAESVYHGSGLDTGHRTGMSGPRPAGWEAS